MIRRIVFMSLVVGLLGIPGLVSAGLRTIRVELSYSGVAASYNLYKDGAKVCVSNNPTAITMDCPVEIGTAPLTFVLTAVGVNGVESPQSAPYVLTPPAINPVTGNYIPQANFTTSGTVGAAPFLVAFDASGSSDFDGIISSYEWNFGDGTTGTGVLTDHTFTMSGTYLVRLTVVDDRGDAVTKSATITVTAVAPSPNIAPTAKFSAVQIVQGTSQLRFDATASSDVDGTISNYAWNFGDGATAVGKIIDHEFKLAGNYTVVLTVTDNAGATGKDTMIITVVDPPPSANLLPVAAISATTAKRMLHFDWEYTGAATGLAGFRLYQNSRRVCEVANPAARQADCLDYVDNGRVRLWVTAYDQAGVESSPSGALTFDSTGLFTSGGGDAPLAMHFSAGTSSDPDGTIAKYAWNFGDGSVAEGVVIDHIYTIPGNYAVTLTVTDNSGGQAQATTTITVTGTTLPPVAVSASFTTTQDKSVTATLSASSPAGRQLTYRITKAATMGTATITNATSGLFTYMPGAGVSGQDTFSFKANDGISDSNEAVVSINVQKVNSAPTAQAVSLSTQEDVVVTGQLKGADIDGDPLTYTIVTNGSKGTAKITNAGTGAFTYTPSANANGQDTVTYRVSDGILSADGVVSLTIIAVNDAPTAQAVSLTTQEDVVVSGQLKGADIDGDPLTYTIVTNGSKGTAKITNAGTGAFTYTPSASLIGQDTVTYRVSDGALSADGVVLVTIEAVTKVPANLLPVAVISATTVKRSLHFDWEYTGTDPGLAGFRLYQNSRRVCEVANPAARQADCLDYVDNGQVRLWVTAYDQNGVESSPSAALTFDSTGMFVSAGGNAPLAMHFSAGTSSDPDGTIAAYAWKFGDGSLADGVAVDHIYTIAGNYVVTLTVTDNSGGQSQATTTIIVTAATLPPVAVSASFSTTQGKSVTGTLSASSPAGSPLTYRITKGATLGTATITNTTSGGFTYVPSAGSIGQDTFSFKANDGISDSNEAVVSINIQKVNSAPTAQAISLSTQEDVAGAGQLKGADIDGDPLTYTIVTNGSKGTAKITNAGTGAFTYTPLANANGQDTVTYRVSDGTLSADGVVSVTIVAVNDAPTAQAVSLSTQVGVAVAGQLKGADIDGDPLSYTIVTNGSKGTAKITNVGTGAFTYTPLAGASGQDTIIYRVSDGKLTADGAVSVTIVAVSTVPIAKDDFATVKRRTTVTIPVLSNDVDPLGGTLSIVSVGTPPYGVATIVKGAITYTADPGFVGDLSFTYTIKNAAGATATGNVNVTTVK